VKRYEVVLAIVGALLVLWGARIIRRWPVEVRQTVLEGDCHLPATVMDPPVSKRSGTAIVIHGLSSNRRIMRETGNWLLFNGLRVYLIDLPGHGDNAEPFTYARAEQCATEAVEALARRGEISPENTILVGHSMGGTIAVRLADRFPAIATVAISPAPMILPKRMPANLLVFSAQFDLPLLRQQAQELEGAAGGVRDQLPDFQQRRAFLLFRVPHASHTSLLFDVRVGREILYWAWNALGNSDEARLVPFQLNSFQIGFVDPQDTVRGSALGVVGILLMFPLVASAMVAACGARGEGVQVERRPVARSILRWVIAAFFAVCVLHYFVPLWFVHIYTGSYLASLLLVVAIVVALLDRGAVRSLFACSPRAGIAAVLLGLATMLGIGAWLNWQLTDTWLNGARWWRFALLFPLLIPYQFIEEAALGAPPELRERGKRASRFGLFLLLRLTLWLAAIFALYVFLSGQILILLMSVYFAAFSILQRLAADGVRRRTGSAAAAAAIGAILAAWFIAAVFPLT
jgi:pimeloyl-ACP methyl ester carboxylesterase